MANKKITKKQLEDYILKLKEYRDSELKPFIEDLQFSLKTGSNPHTKAPKPPILKLL